MKSNKGKTNKKWHLSKFRYDKESGVYLLDKPHTISYSDGLKAETYILDAIKNSKNISNGSEELVQHIKDWPSYYHLGAERLNILKTLDLYKDSKILELGSGCGAMTRYLGENFRFVDGIEGSFLRARIARERCRDLKNVRIFSTNFRHIQFEPIYDIVTSIGVLEYTPIYFADQKQNPKEGVLSFLNLAKRALKKDGILIIAIENKIGIQYWSGCPEDHTGKIFDGIHGYPNGQGPITFSKKEMETLLKSAGFSNISFYYCFPDYKFASTIISDIGDEKNFYLHNWIETPFRPCNGSRIYTFHEGLALKTLSESGLLKEFANSFLIVASQGIPNVIRQPDWIVKRFTMRRRKELQCVTTLKIKPKIYIEKKRLTGTNAEYEVANNTIKMKHKANDSPWYEGDLMIYEIFEAMHKKDFKNEILRLLKIYYQELINRYYRGINDKEGYPLLQGRVLDFLFRHIIKKKEKLLCIDDEWWLKNVPADYMLYRCITYDVIESQKPWLRKKIKNTDKFTVELIKSFFPKYGKARHNKNKILGETFLNLIFVKLTILPERFQFLKNKIIWVLFKSIWDRLPETIKIKIKKWAE